MEGVGHPVLIYVSFKRDSNLTTRSTFSPMFIGDDMMTLVQEEKEVTYDHDWCVR